MTKLDSLEPAEIKNQAAAISLKSGEISDLSPGSPNTNMPGKQVQVFVEGNDAKCFKIKPFKIGEETYDNINDPDGVPDTEARNCDQLRRSIADPMRKKISPMAQRESNYNTGKLKFKNSVV